MLAKEIVRWLDEVKSAFEQDGRGYFTPKTRKNLTEMRHELDYIIENQLLKYVFYPAP